MNQNPMQDYTSSNQRTFGENGWYCPDCGAFNRGTKCALCGKIPYFNRGRNKKRGKTAIVLVILAVIVGAGFVLGSLLLSSGFDPSSIRCLFGHEFSEPTCTEPCVCDRCGEIKGSALGHEYENATCTDPKTCIRCDITRGKALGHSYSVASCTEAKTCERCGKKDGTAQGHKFTAATCTAPRTCSVCGETEGTASGHNFKSATCTAPKTCKDCGATEGSKLDHSWVAATSTKPKTCSRCGETSGSVKGYYASLSGKWKSTQTSVAGTNTYPWVFDEKVKNCEEFTMNFQIASINYGKVYGKFSLYCKNSQGKWEKLGSFDVSDMNVVTKTFKLDSPKTFTQLAVVAPYRGSFSYSSRLWFQDFYLQE